MLEVSKVLHPTTSSSADNSHGLRAMAEIPGPARPAPHLGAIPSLPVEDGDEVGRPQRVKGGVRHHKPRNLNPWVQKPFER